MHYELKMRMDSEAGQTMSEYGVAPLVISTSTVAGFGLLSSGVANLVNSVVGLLP
jgi:Flp pilus assembly pilin Flp